MKDRLKTQAPGDLLTAQHETWLSLATEMADVGRWVYYPQDGTCVLDLTLQRLTGLTMTPPLPAAEFFERINDEDRDAVAHGLQETVESGVPFDIHYRFVRDDGRVIWLKGKGRRIESDTMDRTVIGTIYDVTDLQDAITSNRILANEMAHRVKNLIALVSSMFRMAQRTASDVDALSAAFLGRLEALTALNELIFDSEHRCVSVDELFAKVFAPLINDARVTAHTVDFMLNGTSAQTLVLAINELMTNAVKYGALADANGQLNVAIIIDEAADTFDLAWHETTTDEVEPPQTPDGFGMSVLRRMTMHTFDGDPKITWRSNGLSFTCRWKASEMAGAPGTHDHEMRLFEEAARATAAVQLGD